MPHQRPALRRGRVVYPEHAACAARLDGPDRGRHPPVTRQRLTAGSGLTRKPQNSCGAACEAARRLATQCHLVLTAERSPPRVTLDADAALVQPGQFFARSHGEPAPLG